MPIASLRNQDREGGKKCIISTVTNKCVYTDLKVHITPRENNTVVLLYIFGCYDAFVEPINSSMLGIYSYINSCKIDTLDVKLKLH